MKKVSVMMPAYNAEQFIGQALESILSQDYENLEIVVCDDASKDRTPEIIADYARRYPDRIKAILNQANLGVTKNCNLSLGHCDGDYVSLFAGDDVMLPTKIRKQVAALEAMPEAVMCYHPVEIFDSSTDKTMFLTNQTPREDVQNFEDMLLKGGIPGGCSIMVRSTAIPPGGYDESLKTVSDWLFFLEISLQGNVIKVPDTLARYRKHAGGASQETYSLLEESLEALNVLVAKHPELSVKKDLIDNAKARYIAGEAFRQLERGDKRAYGLTQQVLALNSGAKYKLFNTASWLVAHVPAAAPLVAFIARKAKFFIKRLAA
ncbi:glycosyltransferase [Pseudomonas lurida]|uniref:glycosyltransferase n=1 Tax=Pseudomonas lurida TaxID=244566 RepID=UPI002736BA55|nr:glycosyltransferase [Pseudomonas lurida]WLG28610.1 glycosyltransferase [Pseudomonas lurida]